jgi:hypothetical protein
MVKQSKQKAAKTAGTAKPTPSKKTGRRGAVKSVRALRGCLQTIRQKLKPVSYEEVDAQLGFALNVAHPNDLTDSSLSEMNKIANDHKSPALLVFPRLFLVSDIFRIYFRPRRMYFRS